MSSTTKKQFLLSAVGAIAVPVVMARSRHQPHIVYMYADGRSGCQEQPRL